MKPDDPRWGQGYINDQGYRIGFYPDHLIANTQGYLLEHRRVLFDTVGAANQPCYWCGKILAWSTSDRPSKLCVDHLDNDKLNNDPTNLVPCCYACNTRRGSVDRIRSPRDTCLRGHPFTTETEYWYKGRRTCRICKLDALARSREKKRTAGFRQQHRGPWIYDPNWK